MICSLKQRNRDYGAYQLRKRYNSVLVASIFLAVFIVTSALILPFVLSLIPTGYLKVVYVMYRFRWIILKLLLLKKSLFPHHLHHLHQLRLRKLLNMFLLLLLTLFFLLKNRQITADEAVLQVDGNQLGNAGVANGTGDDILTGQEGMSTDDAFFMVEVMPAFRGGDINKFREWVQKRTNYPQIAIDNKIQGRVYLTFIVEPNGDVSNVTVVKGVDPIIDIEAVKAIQASPKWSPGLQRGQPVRVRFSM